MCLVLSVLMLVLSFNFYLSQNFMASIGSFLTGMLFIWLMVKNIQRVKKIKKEKEAKNVS